MPFKFNNNHFRHDFLIIVVCVLCGLLIANLYVLQVNNSDKYMILSDKNRIRLVPSLPKRGKIITSDGKTVAGNVCRYKLIMDYCDKKTFSENLDVISQQINFTKEEKEELLKVRQRARAYHLPIVIKHDLSWEEYAKISMSFFKLKNVSIENVYVRTYEMPYEFSHIVGHTAFSPDNIRGIIGKTGLELSLNEQLMGKIGSIQMEVNSIGKKVRVIDSVEPMNGEDIVITIDSELQKFVCDLIAQQKAGACIVIDISNGEILASVSVPGFDTNLVSKKISFLQWNEIAQNPLFPLLDRTCSCAYPPGSVFKIAVAYAALKEGISPKDKIYCGGGVKLDNHVFHCWNRGGHGYVDMTDALKLSCDCYFFEIAKRLGIEKIAEHARELGYGELSGIELPNESSGLLPTKKWKLFRYGSNWKPYETMIAGIGQGAVLATLMQSANMMGKIFSNNKNFKSTLIKGKKFEAELMPFDKKHLEIIQNALHLVCTSGTAAGSCNAPYGIYGKTGSSQVRALKENEAGISNKIAQWKHRDHAFFVGCAPFANPKYVVAVFVEHGGGGASIAAPIARRVFDKLMERELHAH